jgi:hypothetical protein
LDPIGWYPYALKKGMEILSNDKVDIILSTYNPLPAHLIASQLKRKTGIPWVADFRDLWSHNPYYRKTQPFQYCEERLEKKTMSNCDFLISVSNPLVKDLQAFHSKKAAVIYNGYDEEDFQDEVPPTLKFTLTYTGQIATPALDPTPLFEVLAELKSEGTISSENIEVRFFGEFMFNNPGILSKKYCLEDIVKTHGTIPFVESIKKQKESTIVLLLGWNDPKAAGDITSKISLIEESGIGIVVNKTNQIKEILVKWLSEFTQHSKIMTHYQPNPAVIKSYSRKEETRELAKIFDDVYPSRLLKNGC